MRKRINLIPNVITAFGLCCGLFSIFLINMTGPGEVTRHLLFLTSLILLIAALADLLDGAVARAMHVETEFGGFFDSMSDAVTFGVAPPVIVLKSLSLPSGSDLSYLLTAAAMVFSLCGILRLVRYNVSSLHVAEKIELLEAHRKHFTGLPIPAAAAALVSSNLFLMSEEGQNWVYIKEEFKAWILFVQMIVLGYFMVSRWKFLSLKSLNIKINSFQKIFFSVLIIVFVIFYGFIQHFSLTFLLISWSYVVIAWVLAIVRRLSGKKSLEEFEPDSEDEIEIQ